MEIQNQVGHRLRGDLSRLHNVLDAAASQGIRSLGQVADRVCEAFDLRDGRGRCQRASCRKALADLEAAGAVSLPAPRRRTGAVRRPRVLPQPVAPAHDVPGEVGALDELALVRVETDAQRLVWNTLMAYEHPRGAGPFVGHQLRYLVGSAHGWLGGVGFAASARRLNVRDTWVGWDDARRRAHLHRVVGLCRMLIRPHVLCRNLASHVLGRAVRAVGEDFERLYGYRSWLLETFVDETGALARGLHLHTTPAVNPDGVPLGVLRAGFDAPAPAPAPAQRDETGKPTQSTKPREVRKSFRWVERGCTTAPKPPSGCPRRAWCAPWTARPTSSTCSSNNARTPRTSSCWCVRRSTASSARTRPLTQTPSRGACSTRCATPRPAAPAPSSSIG